MLKFIAERLSKIDYIRSAIEDQADLSAFRQRPTVRIIAGVSLIVISFIAGWPLISALGALAVYKNEPLIVVIGGPAAYILSNAIFLFGMYLSGYEYSKIFFRWAARVGVEKLMRTSKHRSA
jgi:hypothetical protein